MGEQTRAARGARGAVLRRALLTIRSIATVAIRPESGAIIHSSEAGDGETRGRDCAAGSLSRDQARDGAPSSVPEAGARVSDTLKLRVCQVELHESALLFCITA